MKSIFRLVWVVAIALFTSVSFSSDAAQTEKLSNGDVIACSYEDNAPAVESIPTVDATSIIEVADVNSIDVEEFVRDWNNYNAQREAILKDNSTFVSTKDGIIWHKVNESGANKVKALASKFTAKWGVFKRNCNSNAYVESFFENEGYTNVEVWFWEAPNLVWCEHLGAGYLWGLFDPCSGHAITEWDDE